MQTKANSPARNVVLAALFLALAFVLPMLTGHVPQIGAMLCPMHFPVLLAVRPARTKRTTPQTMRPATMAVSRVA